ncbi:hypothetical protein ERJ75_000139900 [Trypanosoma vivax]|uniref:Uncharacterized protein n=1 Tax=Trypanosoma vivax (strain Y486) TaxID=1055687 RepID=G0TYE4_TRYVY|nr:hypothetical protein TRVL_06055 [Trypanosoma vivax]KAH8619650.1 hypothetical protein ERJ75_000139900 [Trypanosoma vivax]CCC48991.1 conserved hypothetical protein [Trypanosoma vivax Y486]
MEATSSFSYAIVNSVEDFRSIFAPASGDGLLLCYEPEHDSVTSDDLSLFRKAAGSAVKEYGAIVRLHLWNCESDLFTSAKKQLQKNPGTPLLLVIYMCSVADTFQEPMPKMLFSVKHVCKRLASFQHGDKVAAISRSEGISFEQFANFSGGELHVEVDVLRMLEIGKRLMSRGSAEYAAKVFRRALSTLDAVLQDSRGDAEVKGSVAVCLAWLALADLAQGGSADDSIRRLKSECMEFCAEPGGDSARACAAHKMVCALPTKWDGATCSQKRLRSILDNDPHSHKHRCALVVTLFLAGDVERCITEALKLKVLDVPFGHVAICAVADFIGQDHPLLQVSGLVEAKRH